MKKHNLFFAIVATVTFITLACNVLSASPRAQDPSSPVLLDQTATIPGGGGSAEVAFNATNGQRVQILLSASNNTLQPYASLQSPDGASTYNPPINTAVNGTNQAEVAIDQTGQYTLTLFDSSNQGGSVSVKIVVLK